MKKKCYKEERRNCYNNYVNLNQRRKNCYNAPREEKNCYKEARRYWYNQHVDLHQMMNFFATNLTKFCTTSRILHLWRRNCYNQFVNLHQRERLFATNLIGICTGHRKKENEDMKNCSQTHTQLEEGFASKEEKAHTPTPRSRKTPPPWQHHLLPSWSTPLAAQLPSHGSTTVVAGEDATMESGWWSTALPRWVHRMPLPREWCI